MSKLLFSSGFESDVALAAPRDVSGGGAWQDLTGTDAATGFSWPGSIWGGRPSIQMLTYGGTLSNVIQNSIDTVTGHDGKQTKALHLNVLQKPANGTQDPLVVLPAAASAPNDFEVSAWIKLPADLSQKLGSGGYVTAVPEWKSAGDFRVVTNIEADSSGALSWHMTWDNDANGGLPDQTFWSQYNTSVPVPRGEWAYVELSTHRGNSDGHVVLKVNGQTVFDHTGDTIGVNNAPVDRIFVANPYSNKPMDMLVDDIQVQDGTSSAAPAASSAAGSGSSSTPQDATLKLSLSEDAWKGDAQFSVAIDGKTIGAPQTVTTLHAKGASQDFFFKQALTAGNHDVAISFLNDAYGGSAATDRNLYVDGATLDGAPVAGAAAALYDMSTQRFVINVAPPL